MAELVFAARFHRWDEFQKKYREVDLLLLDDIHEIVGRESMQAELLETLQALRVSGKPVVVAGQRSPDWTPALGPGLAGFLESSRVVEIRPPDRACCLAILARRAADLGTVLPDAVGELLGARSASNVAELERALVYAKHRADAAGSELTLGVAAMALAELDQARVAAAQAMKEILEARHAPRPTPTIERRSLRSPRWDLFEILDGLRSSARAGRSRPN
jgi:chromosomal replication initiator protein